MPRAHDDVVRRLAAACHAGDVSAIEAVLDPDAIACDEDRATALWAELNPAKLRSWHRR